MTETMPAPAPRTAGPKPRFTCPPGAADCHTHFYGTRKVYPLAPTCPIPPPYAPVEAYRGVMARLGFDRVVIVQPSAYGTDNRCTLDGLAELGAAARAVVVVEKSVTDAELERLTGLGVRGIRYFMLPGGAGAHGLGQQLAAPDRPGRPAGRCRAARPAARMDRRRAPAPAHPDG